MCRLAAYLGPPRSLESVIAAPCHSLIEQSHSATEAKTSVHGDGFGLAWYGLHPDPALYRDAYPAWSDVNLRSMMRHVTSHAFLAHIRASTTGALSRQNCHPFVHDHWAYMHNGKIGSFEDLRRDLERELSDRSYSSLQGTTDSELLFRLAIDAGFQDDPVGALGQAIALAVQLAIRKRVKPLIRFAAALSDGQRLIAIRYASDEYAPSLYCGRHADAKGVCVVSEPFLDAGWTWQEMPPSSYIVAEKGSVEIRPFHLADCGARAAAAV